MYEILGDDKDMACIPPGADEGFISDCNDDLRSMNCPVLPDDYADFCVSWMASLLTEWNYSLLLAISVVIRIIVCLMWYLVMKTLSIFMTVMMSCCGLGAMTWIIIVSTILQANMRQGTMNVCRMCSILMMTSNNCLLR